MFYSNLEIYGKLLKKRCFSGSEIFSELKISKKQTENILFLLKKNKMISLVRKDLYVANSLATYLPVAEKFEVASKINENSYISHHSAFEFYGFSNQVFNTIFVSSGKSFRPFIFDQNLFKCIKTEKDFGITEIRHIKTTDLERTILDSIKDFEKIGGLEELLECLKSIPFVQEEKLKDYLTLYKNQFLFQKTGFLLESLEKSKDSKIQFSQDFFEFCHNNIGSSTRYLQNGILKSELAFNKKWNLCIPKKLPILN